MTATVNRPLTEREHEIVSMLIDGLTVTQVATRLDVHATTITRRLNVLKQMLGTNTATQTAVECLRRGLLGVDTHRAQRVRAELAARHTSSCALLRPAQCDCRHSSQQGTVP